MGAKDMSAPTHRCALMDETTRFLSLASAMPAEMRRMQRNLQRRLPRSLDVCRDCPLKASCTIRNSFSVQLQVAIQEVLSEYQ
ncbi:MAG: hypothetical protein R6V73_11610 [Anaerolineales bacterium]